MRHVAGPVFMGHTYEARGTVLAVAETPRSELWWYRSVLSEPAGRAEVAWMLMMLRVMKQSSPLWREPE